MTKHLMICLLLLATGLSAQSAILGIPVSALRNAYPERDLRASVLALSEAGYSILHYDANQVIAVAPDAPGAAFPSALLLSEYPPRQHLYLFGGPGETNPMELKKAGKILLEMDAGWLVASDLDDATLRELISSPFIELSLSPLRVTASKALPPWTGEFRTDVAQLVASVSADSVLASLRSLQDFQTRYAKASNRLQVAQWIQHKFQSYGIADSQLEQFNWTSGGVTYDQYNVVATIPGSVNPDQYIIVGGHHDSTSNDPYNFAPGADDNASGTVAALEMARVMMQSGYQPKVSIRFVTFAAEEFGLHGSNNNAALAWQTDLDIRLMMNFDMIANNAHAPSEWQVRLMPYDGSLEYTDFATAVTEQYTSLDAYNGALNQSNSDSYSYFKHGYNVIYFFESDFCPNYHSIADSIGNLDPVYCAEVIKAAVACAAMFGDIEDFPGQTVATDATSISSTGFTANWEEVPGASGYWLDVYQTENSGPASELFFSECLEGSSNTKALEIFNGTGSEVDLSDYRVEYYAAAATNPTQTLDLEGILHNGEVSVIANPNSIVAVLDRAETTSTVASFDGDDQMALRKISTNAFVDLIGRIGTDPGTQWGTGDLVTRDRTLVRKSTVIAGIETNPDSDFPTLATQWISFPRDTYFNLGWHTLDTITYLPGYENLAVGLATSAAVTGLAPGEIYHYVVRADLGYGSFDDSNEISVTTSVDSPEPLIIRSDGGLRLSWQAVNGASSYRVEAAEEPDGVYIFVAETSALELEITLDRSRSFFRVTAIH